MIADIVSLRVDTAQDIAVDESSTSYDKEGCFHFLLSQNIQDLRRIVCARTIIKRQGEHFVVIGPEALDHGRSRKGDDFFFDDNRSAGV